MRVDFSLIPVIYPSYIGNCDLVKRLHNRISENGRG